MNWLEIFGYLGSALVAYSFSCKNILHLRIFNILGASIITIYALIIEAYPVMVLDGLIVLINIYHIKILRTDSVNEPQT